MPETVFVQKQQFLVHYRPGTADEEVLKESFDNDIYFPAIPEYRVQPHHIILDIGAHIGCFTLLAAGKTGTGRVYAFEPGGETFAVLKKNIEENKLSNVSIFRQAMAAGSGKTLLYHDTVSGNWGHTITKQISGESEEVDCITLAHFLQSENIGHVDFIKFNCEGAEFGIIINTPAEILRRINCMLILYHGYLETNISVKQMADHLKKAGFNIHYLYRNKDDNSGWMIAYRAGIFENLFINLRTMPLRISLLSTELKRKYGRLKQILSSR